jgi:hypothetical protein
MWCRCVTGLLLLTACAAGPVERQRLADGSWHLTCRLTMEECIRHFEIVCSDKRYRILSGQSKRELRDVEPGTREYRVSELVAICDIDAAQARAAEAASPSPPASAPPSASAAPVASAPSRPSCVPGSSQACVGPGGCSGGQSCRTDGSGFTSCDCGAAKQGGGDAGS